MTNGKNKLIILDTDLGTDDACALLLLKYLPVKPDYVVASFGNTTLEGAVRNAVMLRKYLGLNYKVVQGLPGPENRLSDEKSFHGPDGLAGIRNDMIRRLGMGEEDFGDVMTFYGFREKLLTADEVVYITIGTLRNLSNLLQNKETAGRLSRIYVMGGGLREFNSDHDTEFNFYMDPDSVKVLLGSDLDITLFPLDVTNHQRLTSADIELLAKTGAYPEYITFMRHDLQSNITFNGIDASILHDTLPVLYMSRPEHFTLTDMQLASDDHGHIDLSPTGKMLHVCTAVTTDLVKNMMADVFSGC